VQAWNNRGQTGTSTRQINAEENIEAFCVPDKTPGVMFCQGGEPPLIGVGTSSDPLVPITTARIYVNGVARADYYGNATVRSFMSIALPPGTYTFKAVAWNTAGQVFTATESFTVAP